MVNSTKNPNSEISSNEDAELKHFCNALNKLYFKEKKKHERFTQIDFAKSIGSTQSSVQRYLLGEKILRNHRVIKNIMKKYRKTYKDLFGDL